LNRGGAKRRGEERGRCSLRKPRTDFLQHAFLR
jgi:hypothetical protein